jgi:aspartyl/asparaginyl beta-hydroxylase (cupin superfamily)|tara:strand:+ start:56 stop:547 length:492 start_codon:yes stop_codon:yes gene_type:complete
MIGKDEIQILYKWAKSVTFPVKKAPTIDGYSNKVIDYYWIKSVKKTTIIRDKLMTDEVREIYENENILFSNYTIFYPNTILKPHRDPDILRYPYKRIQIPLVVPDTKKCYMEWTDIKGGISMWKEGNPQICDVMRYTHQAYNYSDKPLEILFVDVKHDMRVEL